ncbi:MAG: hypothetical protein ACFB6S_04890 [Geminicoccaceae bacterium]
MIGSLQSTTLIAPPESRAGVGPTGATFILFVVLAGVACITHEPWRDEAQAWLIARDVGLWQLVSHQTRYEGSPALWHLLNMPLVWAEMPFWSQRLLNFLFAAGAAALLLWRAPLPFWMRAGAALSYFLLYEYAVIARNYALGMFLLFAALAFYEKRLERPLIYGLLLGLLAQASVFGLLFAFGLGLSFLTETTQRKNLRPAALALSVALIGGIAAFLQILPAEDVVSTGATGGDDVPDLMLANIVHAFGDALAPGIADTIRGIDDRLPRLAALVVLCLVAGTAWALFSLRIVVSLRAFVLFAAVLGGIVYLVAVVRTGTPRVHGHLLLALIASLWISRQLGEDGRAIRIGPINLGGSWLARGSAAFLAVSLAISIALAALSVGREIIHPFSGSSDMARHLGESGHGSRPIIGYRASQTATVLPHLGDKTLWLPEYERFGSYVTWSTAWQTRSRGLSAGEVASIAEPHLDLSETLFLLSAPTNDPRFELLHHAPSVMKDESLYLYGFTAHTGDPSPDDRG